MSRNVPSPPDWQAPPGGETITLHLKLITPMFGGGYEPREVDTVNPIRAASIRGHLRFWWRATMGAEWAHDLKELERRETALWGSVSRPGAVGILVRETALDPPQPCAWPRHRDGNGYHPIPDFDGKPGYALHPFQGKFSRNRIDAQPSKAIYSGTFTVDLFPCDPTSTRPRFAADQRTEVMAAVSAWIRYGGIGARTRRGCGSLSCEDRLPNLSVAPAKGDLPFPVLHKATLIRKAGVAPSKRDSKGRQSDRLLAPGTDAWRQAVEVYRDFRQKVGFARNPGHNGKQPGRSLWPEPDSIRRIAAQYAPDHDPGEGFDLFPRADLGLPIIFHFKDYDEKHRPASDTRNDPADATLEGPSKGIARMASPVITKACAEGDEYVPTVLVLNGPHVWAMGDLRLSYKYRNSEDKVEIIRREQIDIGKEQRKVIPPLHEFQDMPIRLAFIKYVERTWGAKIEVLP